MFLKTAIVLAVLAVAANAAELSMEQGTVAPGKPAALSLKLAAGSDAPTGIQFDLEYDAAALDVSVETGPSKTGLQEPAIGAHTGRQVKGIDHWL